MSILATINKEKNKEGLRLVIAGQEKIGKTTLACNAPKPLLIPIEVGYQSVSIDKTKMIETFDEITSLLSEIKYYLEKKDFPYQSIIFDSATALERLIHNQILQMGGKENDDAVTMETVLGGYGKGYSYANERFNSFLQTCDKLAVYHGINIILTCHVFPAKLIDPLAGEYDSWDLLLHSPKNQKTYGKRELITQWADVIGFLHEPIYVNKNENITQGVSANQGRVLALSRTPSYIAGNRFGIEGVVSIPKENGWKILTDVLKTHIGE